MNKVCIKEAGWTVEGVERGYLEVTVGEDIFIPVELPDELAGATLSIDEFTKLPEGLVFENDTIQGKLKEGCNVFIHVLAEKDGVVKGSSFQLFAAAVAKKKSGCKGEVMAPFSLVPLLAFAGVALLLADKKRKATN